MNQLWQVWTVQQFTEFAGHAWFALQRHGDHAVVEQVTGYRHEIEKVIEDRGITAELLEPTTKAEFIQRGMVDSTPIDPGDETDDSQEAWFLRSASRPPTCRAV